jgi:hypothetical protein
MKPIRKKLDLPKSKSEIPGFFLSKFIKGILLDKLPYYKRYIKLNGVELEETKLITELDLHLLNLKRFVKIENIKDDIYRIVIECKRYDNDWNEIEPYNIEVETEINPNSYYTFLDIEKKRLINIVNESKNIRLINFIQNCIDFIDKELEEYKEVETETKALKTFKNDYNENLTLLDLFESVSKYKYIMNLLVDKGYCQPNTYIWKDEMKGNKGLLAAIIKYLHKQGYYKNNKKPTNEQIILIAKKTFGWELKIDTVKRANPNNFDLSFIPQSSTIN